MNQVWTNCTEALPVNDLNASIICRSKGARYWSTNGYALNEVANINPGWPKNCEFLEWALDTVELRDELKAAEIKIF